MSRDLASAIVETHMAGDLYDFTFVVPEVERARTSWSGLCGWKYQ